MYNTWNCHTLLMGIKMITNILKNYLAIPYKRNLEIVLLRVCLAKGSRNKCPLTDLHKNVPCSFILISQNMETTQNTDQKNGYTNFDIFTKHDIYSSAT